MIVVPEDGKLRIITQADHAHLAGEVLSLWRADGLPESSRRPDVVFAGREHDNGWREADSAPRVDPATGRPHDFTSLPDGPRIEIWRRGVERYAGSRSYATLLICRHAQALLADRRGEPAWEEELFGPMEELVEDLLEVTGAAAESVDVDYRFLALADRISLVACNRWREPFDGWGLHGWLEEGPIPTVRLDPFPLAGATSFRVRCRTIPNRPYADPVDLIGELASARWEQVPVRLAPPPESAAE